MATKEAIKKACKRLGQGTKRTGRTCFELPRGTKHICEPTHRTRKVSVLAASCCMSCAVVAGEPMGVAVTQGMLVVELPTGSLVLMLLLSRFLAHATPRMHKVTSNSLT